MLFLLPSPLQTAHQSLLGSDCHSSLARYSGSPQVRPKSDADQKPPPVAPSSARTPAPTFCPPIRPHVAQEELMCQYRLTSTPCKAHRPPATSLHSPSLAHHLAAHWRTLRLSILAGKMPSAAPVEQTSSQSTLAAFQQLAVPEPGRAILGLVSPRCCRHPHTRARRNAPYRPPRATLQAQDRPRGGGEVAGAVRGGSSFCAAGREIFLSLFFFHLSSLLTHFTTPRLTGWYVAGRERGGRWRKRRG
jgi:hypothetical protein